MNASAIFSRIRFEHEDEHLYYLPEIIRELEQPRPRILIGNRGTGKTTLLKTLSWNERLDNASLRSQLGDDPLSGRYIGLYVKLPEIQLGSIDNWLDDAPSALAGGLLSTYLDSVWLQLAAKSVIELTARGVFYSDPDDEENTLSTALDEFEMFSHFSLNGERPTLIQIRKICRRIQIAIERSALRREDPRDIAETVPIDIGSMGRIIGLALTVLCKNYRLQPDSKPQINYSWRFQICLDEAESLSPRQQLALNSMIRLASHPVFFIASFVSTPSDLESTLIPNLTNQRADLETTRRDSLPAEELRQLLEGVATARIRSILRSSTENFKLDTVLGKSDLNALLTRLVHRSENPRAAELIASANNLLNENESSMQSSATEAAKLPILEAFTQDRLTEDVRDGQDLTTRRFTSSRGRGKTRVMAYLAVHRVLRSKPRYAGSEIVVHLCDSCVRDFLWQMDAIVDLIPGNSDEESIVRSLFSESPITPDIQTRALENASSKKVDRLTRTLSTSPERGRGVVLAIAELSRMLTRSALERRPLDAEPGGYTIRLTSTDQDVSEVIRDATETGYIKRLPDDGGDFAFRLHNSLAPAYGLSWRGAYRNVRLEPSDIRTFANCEEAKIADAARQIFTRIKARSDAPAALFELDRIENDY